MIVGFLQRRDDEPHLLDWTSANGTNYTFCGLIFLKDETSNTFSVDNSPANVCRSCKEAYERNAFTNNPRWGYGETNANIQYNAQRASAGSISLSQKYWRLEARVSRFDKLKHLKKPRNKVRIQLDNRFQLKK